MKFSTAAVPLSFTREVFSFSADAEVFSFFSSCEKNETKKANQGEASKMPIPPDNPLCYVGTHTLRTVPREHADNTDSS